jgi:hypothetical protein
VTTGSQTSFFQEVLDALVVNNHPDLILLRDLCSAVEAGSRMSARNPANALFKLNSQGLPLAGISPALYYELIARVLKLGWSDEFRLLMTWYRPLPSFAHTREEALVDNWAGVLTRVPEPEPGPTAGELIRAWKSEIQCLQGALTDLSRIDVPTPKAFFPGEEPARGFGTAQSRPTLEEQLKEAVQHFFRNTHMLFQQVLEKAVAQLEANRTTELLRILRRLHQDRAKLLDDQKKLDPAKAQRVLSMPIRITEIQDRKDTHLYLDAFRPYRSRQVPISSFDRDDTGPLTDLPGLLGDSHVMRDKQLGYFFDAYGEPSDEKNTLTPELQRRQDLIRRKYSGKLKLGGNDDLVLFLTNLFEDTVRLMMSGAATGQKLSFADSSAIAWRTVLNFVGTYLERMTAHTPFDITEKPPNYLTIEFPRSLTGGLLHECGVYSVRMAYVLLSMARGVDRIFPGTFDMRASWILLPLHVGLILDSRTLALVVLHNQNVSILPDDELLEWKAEWSNNPPETDPSNADALQSKFFEDVAAAAFLNDVDMPVLRFEVVGAKVPVTPKTIWDSYQRNVVRHYDKLFSPLVAFKRARQYQFDLRYLAVTRLQKGWFNRSVVPFWNVTCRRIFEQREAALVKNIAANKDEYVARLEDAIAVVEDAYGKDVFPAKVELSSDLRNDPKLLAPGVRAVFSERLSSSARDTGPVGRVKTHVKEVKDPAFSLLDPVTKKVVRPAFARDEEALVRIPE